MNKILYVYDLLLKLEQCDDFHNRCDYLMEHDEITYLLEYIEQLKQKAELGEHYKHLYSEVKKQKDDVVEYIKSLQLYGFRHGKTFYSEVFNGILRMLGEIDVED